MAWLAQPRWLKPDLCPRLVQEARCNPGIARWECGPQDSRWDQKADST